ncbi:transcription factor HIVEP3 [Chanos chanos]|uniref:Transcription factor HIVEP3 n=1 Tax=Chanos chanos TaxID=29144 RepID=A0A6J2WPA0_CHACN|nr:transcription factor HIVEP3-like [Chanos chanos]
MEALHSQLTTGEQSGGQDQPQNESPRRAPPSQVPSQEHRQEEPHPQHQGQQQPKQARRQHHERKRLRLQQRRHAQEPEAFQGNKSPSPQSPQDSIGLSKETPSEPSSSTPAALSCSMEEAQEGTPKQKRERKPQKPGKYVCTYCGRACAKPSVLQKHIRSHTGERPYPCAPCGFSFKTKSNLYKHRKSHTHKVKAGLTANREIPTMGCQEEPVTDTDDETSQLSSCSPSIKKQGFMAPQRTHPTEISPEDQSQGLEDSHAVKKRLAMRLSRGRRTPAGSSDEASSSFGLSSKGSTESGYFSRSESTEISQESSPNTSAKSYAEIILGKYGRLGHLQRTSRHEHEPATGQEGKSMPFTVPKKQVIDHITKLITINEAVVDTSKIDSVKPRRFSLSRRSSTESKVSAPKEPLIHCSKEGELNTKSSGSITLGVPCEKFQHHSLHVNKPADQTSTAPLLRSHSMPSAASTSDASSSSSRSLRLSQSFDNQQPAQQRRQGMLRRQPAIEIPIGAEITSEELSSSCLPYHHYPVPAVTENKQKQLEPYECEACGTGCNNWEKYKLHKRLYCKAYVSQQPEFHDCQVEDPQKSHHTTRPGALVMRKRRKEESLELDEPTSPIVSTSCTLASSEDRDNYSPTHENYKDVSLKGISVIQHTSSFDKQDAAFAKSQGADEIYRDKFLPHDVCHSLAQPQTQSQPTKPAFRKLVRQQNVQVPEILVTEDSNTNTVPMSPNPTPSTAKDAEKADEFQWPQRSSTLAQLPIEKLPPKKKRLRLAEAAQSSGESSFESLSLPRSPSQDSSVSHASSHSASFEEPTKCDIDSASSRRSRATHTLTIPAGPHHHHHREMRRSASEQAPHLPQHTAPIVETRSKSFDYGSLSPARTPAGWKERRKCLLIRHTAVSEPEEEEQLTTPVLSERFVPSKTSSPPKLSPRHSDSSGQSSGLSLSNTVHTLHQERVTPWQLDQSPGSLEVALPAKQFPHDVLQLSPLIHTGQQAASGSLQGLSGAARAHYSPLSTGLKLEIPNKEPPGDSAITRALPQNCIHYLHHQHAQPDITPCPELLRPVGTQTVPVRQHSDFPIHDSTIYTTLSQTTLFSSQEPGCSARNLDLTSQTQELKNQQTEVCKSTGLGGNKRVLSPSSSLELSPESQQQQKRVKEEEDEKEQDVQDPEVVKDDCGLPEYNKEEIQSCLQSVIIPIDKKEPSISRIHTNLSCSWCYLNYIKPNPSIQTDHQNSVYSSWCTSMCNPNPPGLTSKEVLSLLHCKQRHSTFTYTMAAMSAAVPEKTVPTSSRKTTNSEVHATQLKEPGESKSAEKTEETLKSKEARKDEGEEEELTTSKHSDLSRVQICEGGYRSSEEYVYVRGRGRGQYVCEECGIRCKKPSMLRKHIRLHTDARPYVCQHCHFAFKTKGNLTKHMKSKAHGKKCPESGMSGPTPGETTTEEGGGGVERSADREEHQFSDAEDTEADEEDNDDDDDNDEEESPPYNELRPSSRSEQRALPTKNAPLQIITSAAAQDRQRDTGQPHSMTLRGSGNHDGDAALNTTQAVISSPHPRPTARSRSSPVHSLSPGYSLSPAPSLSPGGESSLRCPSPRLRLSPSPRHSSLSPSTRPASPFSDSPLSPLRPVSPGDLVSSPVGSGGQHRLHKLRDSAKASPNRESVKIKPEKSSSPFSGPPSPQTWFPPCFGVLSRPKLHRESHRVLSHLPLHSQQPTPTLSLMISIGGIQMVQARTTLHLHPAPAPAPPQRTASISDRERDVGAGLRSKVALSGRRMMVVLDSRVEDQPIGRAGSEGRHQDATVNRLEGRPNRKGISMTQKRVDEGDEGNPLDRASTPSAVLLTDTAASVNHQQQSWGNQSTDGAAPPRSILGEETSLARRIKQNPRRDSGLETVPGTSLIKAEKTTLGP